MITIASHLQVITALLATVLASTSSLQAQSATDLERGGKASSEALAQADKFKSSLDTLLDRTKSTIITLQASLDTLRNVGLDEAATDIAAILEAALETERHLTTQIKRLTRLRTDGAPESTDPLMVVLDGIAAAKPKSNSRNRHKEQEASLNELLAFIAKEERLAPFAGLVYYHIGELQFRQATELFHRKKLQTAKSLFLKAINSFEKAADDSRPDVQKAGVGTSLRATSIYHITTINAFLGLSPNLVSKPKRKAHMTESRRWFQVLADNHNKERLENGRNCVSRAQEEIGEMEETASAGRKKR